jgi:hypothetical protein
MTTLLLERPRIVEGDFERFGHHRSDGGPIPEPTDASDGFTLDDLVTSVWEGLAVRAAVACLVCEGPMASGAHDDDGASPTSVCLSCGSQLS